MAKLTKLETSKHEKALQVLGQDNLSRAEKEFVFKNYHEGANHINSDTGAFFTPLELADMAAHDCLGSGVNQKRRVIDLCAGIGALSYAILDRYLDCEIEIVCVELNPDYVEVGKKLVPTAEWYHADVLDRDFILSLGNFDHAISNPPFGKVRSMKDKTAFFYTGSEAEYKVMDVASVVADDFTFIVPQLSAGFEYSGVRQYRRRESQKYTSFIEQTKIESLDIGMGNDTTVCYDENEKPVHFKEVKVNIEIACAETDHISYQVQKQDRLF